MTNWDLSPEEILGRPPLYPVVKPEQFDREAKPIWTGMPSLPADFVLRQMESDRTLQAYLRGIVREVDAKIVRAVTASLTDECGWGVLEFRRFDGMTMVHRTWLHPKVPYGRIWSYDGSRFPLMTLEQFIDNDPVLSEGGARLIE